MSRSQKIVLTLLSFVLGFSLGLNVKFLYESSTFKPYEWETPPKIANCYGPEFSKLQMTRAIDYWTVRGYRFGDYVHNPSADICEREWTSGYIVLKKSIALKVNTLASTRRFTTVATMRGAIIWYKPGSYNLDLLNEHELGHALGFTHLETENHIMHPEYSKMGRDFYVPAK